MLLLDSVTLPRSQKWKKQEETQHTLKSWVDDQLANAVYVKDNEISPANTERQTGKPMFAADLEKRLLKLNPNLHFEVNPFVPSKKALYHLRRGEPKFFVCAFENGVMPEHSVMRVKEEVTRDYSTVGVGPAGSKLNRKDLPKYEVRPDKIEFDDTVLLPGFKKTLIPYGEAIRGWRTVAVRLVENGLATPAEVERIFGADDRPEWAAHMGKKNIALPW